MFRYFYAIFTNLFRAPYIIALMRYRADHPEKYSLERRYRLAQHIIHLIKRGGHIMTICTGTENLPEEGGYVMFSNHQGKYDALGIIDCHEKPCSFVMDEAKSHTILVREFIDLLEGKRLKLNDVPQGFQIMKEMTEEVKEGKKFLIFPEGGYFHNHNSVQEFKPGCFKSAVRAKAPIVPVAIVDSYKAFEGIHFGKVCTQVHFLPPLFYEEYRGMRTTEIAEKIKLQIQEKINESLPPKRRPPWKVAEEI